MLNKKRTVKLLSASVLTGSILGLSPIYSESAQLSNHPVNHISQESQQESDTLNQLYHFAFMGKMPYTAKNLTINQNTKEDVRSQFGPPPKLPGDDDAFDYYHAEMGQPGFAFAYHKDGTISEIRYFGTNVERQQNLGSITPKVLKTQLGLPNDIRLVPYTGEINYVFKTGQYELHFIVGDDQTVDHVNLIEG